jgi:hypothetical protein
MVKGLAVALGVFAFVAAGTGTASATNKCAASKIKSAGKKAKCKLGVYGKAAGGTDPVDTEKLTKCETKFSQAFAKAEAKATKEPCSTTGDAQDIEDKVDAFVTDVRTEIDVVPDPSKCQSAKMKAAGKKAACLLKLESGEAGKGIVPPVDKVQKCKDKFSSASVKAEGQGDCGAAAGDTGPIEAKVEAFVADVDTEIPGVTPTTTPVTTTTSTTIAGCAPVVIGQAIPHTYRLNGTTGEKRCTTSAAMNRFGICTGDAQCGGTASSCQTLPWVTADGQEMPFPTGVQTTFRVAAADSFPTCEHAACVPCGNANAPCAGIPGCEVAGNPNGCVPRGTQGCCSAPGFVVPEFFVNILGGLCSRVDQIGCGTGVVNTSNPQTGDNNVIKAGDTSDPGADCTYNTGDDPAQPACTFIGQGNDYAGKIIETIGDGTDDAAGIHFRLITPELSTTWTDSQSPMGTCAAGSKFDDGEGLISQLLLKAEPTSAGASGSFTELGPTGSTCKRAGSGFTAALPDGPITVPGAPAGPARPQSYDGTVGSVTSAVSVVFSGPNSPIRDIGFVAITPNQPAVIVPDVACSCTIVPGCPE